MASRLPFAALLALAASLSAGAAHALKPVRFPEVPVALAEPYEPDAALKTALASLNEAVAKKDAEALFRLVGPTFVWTMQSETTEEFDLGRDALTNFKVAFGFRQAGQTADGNVEEGPYWDQLAAILKDATLDHTSPNANLVCLPRAAAASDDEAFEKARTAVESDTEPADWYYAPKDVPVTKSPTDTASIGTLGRIAVPVMGSYPEPAQGKESAAPTHLQVVLPSGKTGWVPVGAVSPLFRDRLCLAKTEAGDWRIASYDQTQ